MRPLPSLAALQRRQRDTTDQQKEDDMPETAPNATTALLDAFPSLVDAECRRRGISRREASRQLGLSAPTVTRVIQGKGCDANATLRLLQWLDLSADWLREPTAAANAYQRGWDDCASRVRVAIEGGDS